MPKECKVEGPDGHLQEGGASEITTNDKGDKNTDRSWCSDESQSPLGPSMSKSNGWSGTRSSSGVLEVNTHAPH
jgi:hypothetical protein